MKKKESPPWTLWAMAALFALLALVGVWSYREHSQRVAGIASKSLDPTTLGQVGDSFGSVNSLLSLLTVLGLAFGFFAQSWVAHEQSKTKLDDDKARHLDSFENSFYRLLNLFLATREVLLGVKVDPLKKDPDEVVDGRLAIVASFKNWCRRWDFSCHDWDGVGTRFEATLSSWDSDSLIKNPLSYRQTFLLLKSLLKSMSDLKNTYPSESGRFEDVLKAILSDEERLFISLYCVATKDAEFIKALNSADLLPDLTSPNNTLGTKLQSKLKAYLDSNVSKKA